MLHEAIETPTNPRYVVSKNQRLIDASLLDHFIESVCLVLNGRMSESSASNS